MNTFYFLFVLMNLEDYEVTKKLQYLCSLVNKITMSITNIKHYNKTNIKTVIKLLNQDIQ